MLDPFDDDLALRTDHVGADPIELDVRPFAASDQPQVVWTSEDGSIRVLAVAVHHEPVPDAVAYRVETPDGVVVISGDTRVCTEVEDLARGADLLVHEACRTTALADLIAGTPFETIFSYHADTVPLGAMAARAGVPHVVLTHLIPPPDRPADEDVLRPGPARRRLPGRDHRRPRPDHRGARRVMATLRRRRRGRPT